MQRGFLGAKETPRIGPIFWKLKDNEHILLYLDESKESSSLILIKENNQQLPIYYIIKALLQVEASYLDLEKFTIWETDEIDYGTQRVWPGLHTKDLYQWTSPS